MDTAQLPQPTAPTTATERQCLVQTWELRKVYRTGFWLNRTVETLRACTLSVYEGETFGLLGPNGAGKTTLLKMLLGIVRPTSGRALLFGKSIGDRSVRHRLGYLPENAYFYDFLTAWEFLEFTAGLFEIPPAVQKKRIPELLDLVGLSQEAARKKQMRRYSKGMLQRVGFAQALIGDPELVFLDEPMSGLDPLGRYQIRQLILSLKEQGKTIFFNSHVLGDVEQICDRVALLAQGELLCIGSLDELLGTEDSYRLIGKGGEMERFQAGLDDFSSQGDRWGGVLQGDPAEFLAQVQSAGGHVLEMKRSRLSLEEFFIQELRQRGIESSR